MESHSIFVAHHHLPSPWPHLHPSRICCSNPRWDSNAETFRPRNFSFNSASAKQKQQHQQQQNGRKRRWWSDEYEQFEDDEDEEEEPSSSSGFWEQLIDTFWILKVFKSYGWTLPVILASWLLSSGPKAFLMALALPLGQSALALAFEKLWGQSERKPKRKNRMGRKSRTMNGISVEEEPEEKPKTRKGRTDYRSWVIQNNGSVDRGSPEASSSFGGWDDLERSRPATESSRGTKGSQRMSMEAGRLSRREGKSDTPLLLRLLIAIFPFLGTWTKMFFCGHNSACALVLDPKDISYYIRMVCVLTMGLLSIIRKIKRKEKEMRILMVGLDNSGKTTIVLKINGEDTSVISPTLGFNIKTITYQKYTLNIWDVGGQKTIRSYWRNYFEQTDGLVWVVDSSDLRRLDDCKMELDNLLKEERLSGSSLLILANKQDIKGALTPEEIAKVLNLEAMDKSRHWNIVGCSAYTGQGLLEGFDWLVQDIASRIYMLD
ncbi:hypothetical protein RJT34_24223 [Clitoria ternatea]|uniref:ADP-ribosylation factor-like protein 2 n=1 Tax=Clitoria ternatea TaxID=43366 RepID=A0AAN9FMJ1_CLITE